MADKGRITEKYFLRCPCCGRSADPSALLPALVSPALEVLRQQFVGRGNGTNGGAVRWSRRPMKREELEIAGLAVARAGDAIIDALGEPLAAHDPAGLLASFDAEEAERQGQAWIDAAELELERRRQIVEEDRLRRMMGD